MSFSHVHMGIYYKSAKFKHPRLYISVPNSILGLTNGPSFEHFLSFGNDASANSRSVQDHIYRSRMYLLGRYLLFLKVNF